MDRGAWQQNPKFYGIKRGIADSENRAKPKASGSVFDRTVFAPPQVVKPGVHQRVTAPPNESAFRYWGIGKHYEPDPHAFVRAHSGFGGSTTMRAAAVTASTRVSRQEAIGRPPRAGCTTARPNPPNTEFRRAYERGDLPCVIDHVGAKRKLKWRIDARKLDYSFYLPLFFDGLREEQNPLPLIASLGINDLLAAAPEKVLPVLPQLIIPLRNALNTRRPAVMTRALEAMKALVTCDAGLPPAGLDYGLSAHWHGHDGGGAGGFDGAGATGVFGRVDFGTTSSSRLHAGGGRGTGGVYHSYGSSSKPSATATDAPSYSEPGAIGRALVPYYRQLLPVLNVYATRYSHASTGIDDGSRTQKTLVELIAELLNVLELNGGSNAFLNIKYMVPNYVSCVQFV